MQGDEPLLLPKHIDLISDYIKKFPTTDTWNAIGRLENKEELDKDSFVKCAVSENGRILYCFRRSPSHKSFAENKKYIFKVLGIIAYKKDVLISLTKNTQTFIEKNESIEQIRILECGYSLNSVLVSPTLPSVNEPKDVKVVENVLKNDIEQQKTLKRIL